MCAVDLARIRDVARQHSQGSKARPRNCQGLGHDPGQRVGRGGMVSRCACRPRHL